MSTVNGFQVGSETLKYNYESLENYNTPNFSSSSSKAYAIGDYVMYNGKLYKCTTATTGGTWNVNNWAEAILTDDVTDQKNAFSEFIEDGTTTSVENIPLTFNSGRVFVSNNVITVSENSKFAYMKYVQIIKGTQYTINVPSGIDIYADCVNRNNGTYTRVDHVTSAWTSGQTSINYIPTADMQDYYLVFSVKKTNNTDITVEEASGITLTYDAEKTIPIVDTLRLEINKSAFCNTPTGGQILYNADTSAESNFIVNAISYNDGTIIACRPNGTVVRIGYSGTEETLLTVDGSGCDWRLCWKDSNDNVYVSPHASWGTLAVEDRGLYKLVKGGSSFTKVIALYNPNSSIPTETQANDDTIWTMCEDESGALYAGVYAHTIRPNPAIYKSTDGGNNWTYLVNFNTSGYTTSGRHIHCVIYSRWKKALYCIVGEVNTIFKSLDGGATWENLRVPLRVKGSSMLATANGIIIGSDGAYNCEIDLLYNDDKTHETVYSAWANTVFGIRQSDVTGIIYAFTKIDSVVGNANYYPPYGVLYGSKTIEAWKAGEYTNNVPPTNLSDWEAYNAEFASTYPDDAIRPQHFSIVVSRDGGKTFELLKAIPCDSRTAYGIWTIGEFYNGECLCGVYTGNWIGEGYSNFVEGVSNPIVISEGKHNYVSGGCDLSGEIFIKTNTSTVVEIL